MSHKYFSVSRYGDKQGPTIFFFCPFNIRSWQLNVPGLPIRNLTNRGYQVISYAYKVEIATETPELTVGSIEAMLTDAAERIARLPLDRRIIAFGSSMGSVMAANLAARQPRITDVILNVSYSDIAEHIYMLPAIPMIPRAKLDNYIRVSGGRSGLHTIFDRYSPINLASQLKHTRILLFQAENDRLLKYVDTQGLADALRNGGVVVEQSTTRKASHYGSILYNYIRPRRYIDFLNK